MKKLTKKTAERKYNIMLKKVIKDIGNNITDNVQLHNYINDKLKFGGIYMVDEKIPKTKNTSFIINTDTTKGIGKHWCAVYVSDKGYYYVYDSFGRKSSKILKPFVKGKIVIDTEYDAEQNVNEVNCGQRCVAWLLFRKEHGIYNALQI